MRVWLRRVPFWYGGGRITVVVAVTVRVTFEMGNFLHTEACSSISLKWNLNPTLTLTLTLPMRQNYLNHRQSKVIGLRSVLGLGLGSGSGLG